MIRSIIGISPFFIGFAILGQCLFWELEKRFDSFSYAVFSLFAMMNGDNLVPIHEEMVYLDMIKGNLYCFSYVSFSVM